MNSERQAKIGSGFGMKSTAMEVLHGTDLTGKTAIVTGGYSGLGLETVRALVSAGAKVFVPARRPDVAANALSEFGDKAVVAKMDLADLNSVTRFTDEFNSSGSAIDILINNAAIMACPETRVGDNWEAQFGVNHMGHFLMTTRLMPAVLKADAPRIVSLSSIAHKRSDIRWDDIHFTNSPYEKWEAYGQAKTANALFAVGLQAKYGGEGLLAFSVHPGGILTPLQRHLPVEEMVAMGWTDENGNVSEAASKMFKSPAGGAATSIWCATSAQIVEYGGLYCEDCDVANLITAESPRFSDVAPWAVDEASADRLWEISEAVLN